MTSTENLLQAKIAKKPDSLLFARLADELRLARNLDAALPVVEAGLSRNPEFIPGLLVRGKILFDMNAFEEAESTFRKVYRRDPLCLSAVRHLAEIATKLNRISQAEQYWRVLQALDPLDATLPALAPLQASRLSRPVPLEDDPFAHLEPLAPVEEKSDELSASDLSHALDAALDGVDPGASRVEFFPADDDGSVTSSDVGSAISSLFGTTPPKSSPPPQPENEIGLESPFSLVAPAEASEEQSEQAPTFASTPEAVPVPSIPVSASTAPTKDDLNGALDSLFGDDDDDLPLELSTPTSSEFQVAPEVIPTEVTPAAPVASKPDLENDLASALDELFGDDDLFEEPSLAPMAAKAPSSDISTDVSDEAAPNNQDVAPSLSDKVPDLDSILNEQLSSRADVHLESEIDAALLSPILDDDDLPGFNTLPGLSGNAPSLSDNVPDLDSILNEQLASKADVHLESEIDAALSSPILEDDDLPGFNTLPGLSGNAPSLSDNVPDLDSILNEQLASKADVHLESEIDAALLSPILDDDDLPGFNTLPGLSGNAPSLSDKVPDLDSILNEQLSSRADVHLESEIDAALLSPILDDDDLPGFNTLPGLSGNAPSLSDSVPDLDSILNEQLSSKADVHLESEIDAALSSPILDDDDLPGFNTLPGLSGNAPSLSDNVPDLDSILNEQLSSRADVHLESEIDAALSSPILDDDDLPGFQTAPAAQAPASKPEKDFDQEFAGAFANLFADDDDLPEELPANTALPSAAPTTTESTPVASTRPAEFDKAEDEVSAALDKLFDDEDSLDSLLGDSSNERLQTQLRRDPEAPIPAADEVPQKLTSTLAEIYLEQGFIGKALQAYRDLVAERPDDLALKARLAEIEKLSDNHPG